MEKNKGTEKVKTVNGIRVLSTWNPEGRPPIDKWIKSMRISQVAWYYHPDGKQKAEEIMAPVGIEYLTFWESIKQIIKNE